MTIPDILTLAACLLGCLLAYDVLFERRAAEPRKVEPTRKLDRIEIERDGHVFIFIYDSEHEQDARLRAAALLMQLAEPGDELRVLIAGK